MAEFLERSPSHCSSGPQVDSCSTGGLHQGETAFHWWLEHSQSPKSHLRKQKDQHCQILLSQQETFLPFLRHQQLFKAGRFGPLVVKKITVLVLWVGLFSMDEYNDLRRTCASVDTDDGFVRANFTNDVKIHGHQRETTI